MVTGTKAGSQVQIRSGLVPWVLLARKKLKNWMLSYNPESISNVGNDQRPGVVNTKVLFK